MAPAFKSSSTISALAGMVMLSTTCLPTRLSVAAVGRGEVEEGVILFSFGSSPAARRGADGIDVAHGDRGFEGIFAEKAPALRSSETRVRRASAE